MKNIDFKKLYPSKEEVEAVMADDSDSSEEYIREEYQPIYEDRMIDRVTSDEYADEFEEMRIAEFEHEEAKAYQNNN